MTASLAKLAALPEDTKVYCAHEYTVSNLRFAVAAEPGNPAVAERLAFEQQRRERGEATVPSTIGIERRTNPFLRPTEASVLDTLHAEGRLTGNDAVAAFAALREWKNTYRG